MSLKSSAFEDGRPIPSVFTGEGADRSPPLRWSKIPEGTKEFVLICEDPDAPGSSPFVHWVIYNLSPSTTQLPEGFSAESHVEVPVRADQGLNDFGNTGYGGPMPPPGHGVHRYVFRLYALNTELAVPPGADVHSVRRAMNGHLIDEARLIGTYERKARKVA